MIMDNESYGEIQQKSENRILKYQARNTKKNTQLGSHLPLRRLGYENVS